MSDRPVVVGVDGTTTALHAVAWAAHEATLRHRPLRIVHAAPYLMYGEAAARGRADAILSRARSVARQIEPELDTTVVTASEGPVGALAEASRDADLIVVGMIGERDTEIVIGSVALGVPSVAHCPVAVVRGHATDGPVVLGVDQIDHESAAVTLAFDDAERHRCGLVLVHALAAPLDEWVAVELAVALRRRLDPWQAHHLDVAVDIRTPHGAPAAAILHEAATARHVVLSSRGRHAAARATLGSVSRFVLRHSPCPVTVVPHALSAGPVAEPAHDRSLDPHDPAQLT